MPLFRPEALTALKRWREPMVIGVLALVSVRLLWQAYTLDSWTLAILGLVMLITTGSLMNVALTRLKLRSETDGPGLVEIDERNITYLAPQLGGSVTIDSIRKIDIAPSKSGGHNWILYSTDGPPVLIPFAAAGADRLVEAFNVLSGLGQERIRKAISANALTIVTIWERG